MFTCMITPYTMAFRTDMTASQFAIEGFLDFAFALDLLINFCTAFHDEDFNLVDSHKVLIFY